MSLACTQPLCPCASWLFLLFMDLQSMYDCDTPPSSSVCYVLLRVILSMSISMYVIFQFVPSSPLLISIAIARSSYFYTAVVYCVNNSPLEPVSVHPTPNPFISSLPAAMNNMSIICGSTLYVSRYLWT
jgi:hypothetical protein